MLWQKLKPLNLKAMPITKATDTLPEIEWEKGDKTDSAGDGHVYMYEAIGESEDGRTWGGEWIECDGEFDEITDIVETTELISNDSK